MFSTTTTMLARLSSSSIVATPLTVLMSIALSQRRRLSKTNFNSHQSSADDVFPSYFVSSSSSHLFIQFRNYAEAMPGASDNTTNNNNNNNTTHPTLPEADFNTSCPFRCLGLTRTATKEEVRANYLQLAKVHHPDVGGETKKFRRVQAAYKQSIEMIETGYAAKTAKKEKEANYRAPNERQRNYRGRPGDDDADEEDEQHARKSSYYYRSTRKSGTSSTRDTDASSAASYSYAESSAFSSGNRRAADRKSNYNNNNKNDNEYAQKTKSRFSSQSPSSTASASYFYSERDRNAKAFNNSDEWFRETYEKSNSSWTTASKRSEAEKKKRKQQQEEDAEHCTGRPAYASSSFYKNSRNSTTSSSGSHDYNAKQGGENPSDSHHRQHEEEARSSSSEEDYFNKKTRQKQQQHQSETEREFGEDEEWFQFKTNFYDMNAKNLTPRDLYRLRFAQATTAKEIDEIYSRAMEENVFSGWDIGEPLHLALERYHLDSQLGLGEKHLEKCFDTIEDWEKRTKSTASCIYYQCILKLYTNEQMLFLFPDIDASIIAEVVWKVLQKMQDKEVSDDTGIGWWNLMNSALMYRDPHGYGNTSG